MEQFPMNTPEATQDVAPQVEQGTAEAGAAEALSASVAAGLGEAALNAATPETSTAEVTPVLGAEVLATGDPAKEVAPMPEVQAVNMTQASEVSAPAGQPAGSGEVSATIEATVAAPGVEAVSSPEIGKVSDSEMVDYILGRLREDLTLPDIKDHPEKAKDIQTSIQIFDLAAFVMNDNKNRNKEPVSAETILGGIASENRYMAEKSQNDAEKAEHAQRAKLADEWANSYANRKAKLEAERTGEGKANVAVEEAATPLESQSQAAPGVVSEAAPVATAVPVGEQTTGAEQAPIASPANAGGTTQPNAVPLSTEGIV